MTFADHALVGEVGFAAWKSSTAGEAAFNNPVAVEAARKAFRDYPARAKGDVAIAELEGRLVGWGAREDAPDDISDIWVDPAHQGRGIGSRLVRHFLQCIEAEGFTKATIQTRVTNTGAIQLYERCGFAIVWQGDEWDAELGLSLPKVHLEKRLRD